MVHTRRGGWRFTYRGKQVAYVCDVNPDNENSVRERDVRLDRTRRRFPKAKEHFEEATK